MLNALKATLFAAVMGGTFALPALATDMPMMAEVVAGDITISHGYAFETAATAKAGAAYVMIANNGANDDTLLGVNAAYPMVQIHNTVMTDGVAKMEHQESLPLAAGATLEMAPGGYHVMFMGLSPELTFVTGETVTFELVFEKAGAVSVTVPVVVRTEGAMKHSH